MSILFIPLSRAKQAHGVTAGAAHALFGTPGRFTFLLLFVVSGFGMVLGQLFWLHVSVSPQLRAEAAQSRQFHDMDEAGRGAIVDSRGVDLAVTRKVWDVGVDAYSLTEKDFDHISDIADILGIPWLEVANSFERRLRESSRKREPEAVGNRKPPVFVHAVLGLKTARKVNDADPEEQVKDRWAKLATGVDKTVAEKIKALRIRGVIARERHIRDYPNGKLASHLIGYVTRDGTPAMGVEKTMDWFLRGQCGSLLSQTDGRNTELAHLRIRQIEPVEGQRVELTIDSLVQEVCENELEWACAEFRPKAASIIVSEATTGRLLGLANWPTFDLRNYNNPKVAPLENQRNRAVTDIYEPGSVFKIIPVSMALNEGVVTANTVFDCTSASAPYRGRMLSLPGDSHHLGESSVRDIVRESSNRGAALIAMRVTEARGEQMFYDYAAGFGIGRPTGLITCDGLRGAESIGILHDPSKWDTLTITRLPMGHAVSATPLQMHYAMGVIASGGKLFQPQLVNRVLNADGSVAIEYPVRVRGKPLTNQVARTMAAMLRDVCRKGGTAASADIEGYEVAGKTGTTQKIIPKEVEIKDRDGKVLRKRTSWVYSNQHHVASFSGFFPAESPRIVITVVLDEPKISTHAVAYGGKVAAPVFKRTALEIIRRLNIPSSGETPVSTPAEPTALASL
ncbi:MAG: penicillin-binding protein 2 [Puniceicoccales bacterium]|jgi:cell division protein FtsI/penicillin-binding protein 2|nr:penicillin-binding protein 2 [Puniceicoccales bacterium]